MRCYISITFLC